MSWTTQRRRKYSFDEWCTTRWSFISNSLPDVLRNILQLPRFRFNKQPTNYQTDKKINKEKNIHNIVYSWCLVYTNIRTSDVASCGNSTTKLYGTRQHLDKKRFENHVKVYTANSYNDHTANCSKLKWLQSIIIVLINNTSLAWTPFTVETWFATFNYSTVMEKVKNMLGITYFFRKISYSLFLFLLNFYFFYEFSSFCISLRLKTDINTLQTVA